MTSQQIAQIQALRESSTATADTLYDMLAIHQDEMIILLGKLYEDTSLDELTEDDRELLLLTARYGAMDIVARRVQ